VVRAVEQLSGPAGFVLGMALEGFAFSLRKLLPQRMQE
jgi:hypothetical protein